MEKNETEIIKELIKRRRYQILVHSYIYYRLYEAIIPNSTFDAWANELIMLQTTYPKLSEEVDLYDSFREFTSVGCAALLPLDGDERLEIKASHLIKQHKDQNESKNIITFR